jgi:hypothetical protein
VGASVIDERERCPTHGPQVGVGLVEVEGDSAGLAIAFLKSGTIGENTPSRLAVGSFSPIFEEDNLVGVGSLGLS